ncbi:tetratricopeptide repeat protein [Moraxella sp. ZY210820]|uniref:tetratricopeptide repeat protein n=1 Tax=unclassified Moraxella TaxID=2685852 RepID=UPI0027315BDA|nr:tetratricopeptide repeat protein [Moraxella sp. ZY210820]WLF84948.1 sel1 repeat family protein [Moraxella sp. ZY210820]
MKNYILSALFGAMLATSSMATFAYQYQYGSYSAETLKKAQAGDADAQNMIGDGYFEGNGIKQDYQKAFEWYMKAANNGHLEAMNSVAYMYDNGYASNDVDVIQAEKWYKKAADKGHASSQFMLAIIYRDDETFQNKKLYREYLVKSANNGHDPAQYELALAYEDGLYGFKQDEKQAVKYYQLAVAQKHPIATNNLALMYEEGRGVNKDINKALSLYEQAYQLGDVAAAYNLGNLYYEGELVKKDYKKAVMYHEFVLENTDDHDFLHDSLDQLINMYENGGYGIKKNLRKVKELEQMDIH